MIQDWTQQKADLEAVHSYIDQSLSFTTEARIKARALLAQAISEGTVRTPVEYLAFLCRVVALADNGHDFLDTGRGWWPSTRLPVSLDSFADGPAITRGEAEYRPWMGWPIVAVDGRPVADLLLSLRDFFGGPDTYVRWCSLWALEWGGVLHALGLANSPDRIEFTIALADRTETVELSFVAANLCPPSGNRAMQLGPTTREESDRGWCVGREGPEPMWLLEPGRWFRQQRISEGRGLYLQFRTHFSPDGEPMEAFLRTVEQELQTPPSHLVLDLRFDSGGNSDLTIDFVHRLVSAISGSLFVVVGPRTFSAGIVTAALLKARGGERVKVVGEEVGDRLRWWSEGRFVSLPHSGYQLHLCDGLWDLQNGCAGEEGCYGDRFDIRVTSLSPDLPAALTSAAWRDGRDPALEAIAKAT